MFLSIYMLHIIIILFLRQTPTPKCLQVPSTIGFLMGSFSPASNRILSSPAVCSTLGMSFFPASVTPKHVAGGQLFASICPASVPFSPGSPASFSSWRFLSPPSLLHSLWRMDSISLPVVGIGSWPRLGQLIYSSVPFPWPKSFTDDYMTQTRPMKAAGKENPGPVTARM